MALSVPFWYLLCDWCPVKLKPFTNYLCHFFPFQPSRHTPLASGTPRNKKKSWTQPFPGVGCWAICTRMNVRGAVICPRLHMFWRFFTLNANLCGRWCMCFFSSVITNSGLWCNTLHLISSRSCAPTWVKYSH